MGTDWSEPVYEAKAGIEVFPTTEEGWRELYSWREDTFLLRPYGGQYQKQEHLFRAFDDNGNEMAQTRRILGYGRFIVSTDARALAGGRLVLDLENNVADVEMHKLRLERALQIWRRSKMQVVASTWFLMLCGLGDWWVVAVPRGKFQTELIGYDPRVVVPTYDVTGKVLVSVTIESKTDDHTYKQVIDGKTITTTVNNGTPEVVTHNLGVPPVVHLRCIPWGTEPGHSLNAVEGIERAVATVDAMFTQQHAIASRFANPTLVTYGFKVAHNSDVNRFGRTITGVPKDARVEYLTGTSTIKETIEVVKEIDRHIRDTSPEFLFASDGAQESGEARNMRARAFIAKIEDIRDRVYPELARVLAMAVALEERRELDEGIDAVFTVKGPPVLPQSVVSELTALTEAERWMKRADIVRHLQRIGLVTPDADPDEYAAEVADEQAAKATAFLMGDARPGGSGDAGTVVEGEHVEADEPARMDGAA